MHQKLIVPEPFIRQLEEYLSIRLLEPIPRVLAEYAKAIHEISGGLKKPKDRQEFLQHSYLEDKNYRQAYLLYYTTSNLLKFYHPLTELDKSGFFEHRQELHVLDLGSGTGTALLGFSFWLKEFSKGNRINFTACDRSAAALTELEIFYRQLGFDHSVTTRQTDFNMPMSAPERKSDLIIGANFLNELSENARQNVFQIVRSHLADDGYVIFLEPAQIETSRTLLKFRDTALQNGWYVYAPCLTRHDCPALIRETDWCHDSRVWERPKFISILDDMIGNVKKSLKFSYVVLTRHDVHVADFLSPKRDFQNQFRVVSELFREKGRSHAFMCNDLGRNDFLRNKRDRTESNEDFNDLERYDVVQVDSFTVKKHHIQIEKDSRVTKLKD
jgi:SAM-dependent methyltransferase